MESCKHEKLKVLNHFDTIRKYRCLDCNAVMMCECDQSYAMKHLPHQTREATEYDTQRNYAVTHGFVSKSCNSCRGLPEEAHPRAQIHGQTSKLSRYYWREIWMESGSRMDKWEEENPEQGTEAYRALKREAKVRIDKEVKAYFHDLHKKTPKYIYTNESQAEIIQTCNVKVDELHGIYVKHDGQRKTLINHKDGVCTAEEFATRHYNSLGYSVLLTESIPFHVLFGIYCWMVVQDPADPRQRICGIANHETGEQIWFNLPEDFGSNEVLTV